jgi:hypothetical protein
MYKIEDWSNFTTPQSADDRKIVRHIIYTYRKTNCSVQNLK